VLRRVVRAIDGLAERPWPSASTALLGCSGMFRLRVGDYRVVYSVADDVIGVVVVAINEYPA
jgi:mRNA interferase RelE/StbE